MPLFHEVAKNKNVTIQEKNEKWRKGEKDNTYALRFSFMFARDRKVRVIMDSIRYHLSHDKCVTNFGSNDSVLHLISSVILDKLFPLQMPHKGCRDI